MRSPSPVASVIVVAHDRRNYLREAVESVVRQDVEKGEIEILVVKNFLDPDLEAYLHQVGARSILCTEEPFGQKLLAGFREARGDVLLFLEDDDAFEPSRLGSVLGAFRSIQDLGFYRNGLTFVDAEGRPFAFTWRRPTRTESLLLEDRRKPDLVRFLVHRDPDFNCSSMAVHREVFERVLPYLSEAKGRAGAPDILLFFAALISNRSMLIDGRRLTRYRIHGANASQLSPVATGTLDVQVKRLGNTLRFVFDSNLLARRMVADSERPFALRLIEARILVNRLQIAYTDSAATRADVARILPSLVRYLGTFPVRNSLLTVLLGPLYVASPVLVRKAWSHAAASVRTLAA